MASTIQRPTPFQVEVSRMARQMTIIVGALTLLVAVILRFVFKEPMMKTSNL
jgi:hypothetical protein